jgi:hypothetical protein
MLIALSAGTYGINKLLSGKAARLRSLQTQSVALEQQQISLRQAKKDIAKYAELDKIAHSVVPEDKNQAVAVREIVNIAAANNVKLASVTFPASTLGGNAPAASPGSSSAAPSTGTMNSKTAKLSQLVPVKNIPGVYLLQITVISDPNQPVLYSKFIRFLDALEHNRRTAQVSSITLQPDIKDRGLLSFSLILNEYIKP